MKLLKLLSLIFILSAFTYSNLFSQLKPLEKYGKLHPRKSLTVEGKMEDYYSRSVGFSSKDKNVIQLESYLVVDSLIITSSVFADEKHMYAYDAEGRITEDITYIGSGGKWKTDWREVSEYNSDGKISTYLYQSASSGSWENIWLDVHNYDSNGNDTLYLIKDWYDAKWNESIRIAMTYDSNNNMTSDEESIWYDGKWNNSFLANYTYDANNNLVSGLSKSWSGSSWVNGSKFTYTYDSNMNRILGIREDWNGSNWVVVYQFVYAYNSNGDLTSLSFQKVDGNDWFTFLKDRYTYDSNNNKTSYLHTSFTKTDSLDEMRNTFFYDSDGRMIRAKGEIWDSASKTWVGNSTIKFSDLFGRSYYFRNVGTLNVFYKTPTSVEETKLNTLNYLLEQNYPNPFNPSTQISYSIAKAQNVNISVYNALGQKVAELVNTKMNAGTHSVNFNGSNLASGLYFYKLATPNYTKTMKMLLLK